MLESQRFMSPLPLLLLFSVALLAQGPALAQTLTGTWTGNFTVSGSEGEGHAGRAILTLTQEGDVLTGAVGPEGSEPVKISNGAVDGKRVTFDAQTEGPLMHFDLEWEGDRLRGIAEGKVDSSTIRAKLDLTRAGPPGEAP